MRCAWQDFDPPDYERDEQEGTNPLKEGHMYHPADFINFENEDEEDLGIGS